MTAPHRLSSWKTEEQKARVRLLRPLCPMCKEEGVTRAGVELDHIFPLHKGGSLDDDNTQLLCVPHHAEKTAKDMGYVMKGCDEDGWPLDPRHPLSQSAGRRRAGRGSGG